MEIIRTIGNLLISVDISGRFRRHLFQCLRLFSRLLPEVVSYICRHVDVVGISRQILS